MDEQGSPFSTLSLFFHLDTPRNIQSYESTEINQHKKTKLHLTSEDLSNIQNTSISQSESDIAVKESNPNNCAINADDISIINHEASSSEVHGKLISKKPPSSTAGAYNKDGIVVETYALLSI